MKALASTWTRDWLETHSAAGIGLYLGTGERLEDNYMSGSRYLDVVYWSDFVLVAQFVESNHWGLQGH